MIEVCALRGSWIGLESWFPSPFPPRHILA